MKGVLLVLLSPWFASAACLAVRGERVLAGEVSTVEPGFHVLDADVPLFPAPAIGVKRWMTAAEVKQLARQQGVAETTDQDLCIERQAAALTMERLRPVLEQAVPEAELTVLEHSRQPVPDGELVFMREELVRQRPAAGQTVATWRGAVVTAEGRRVPVWAKVRAVVRRQCLVAAHDLAAGQVLSVGDLRAEEREEFPSAAEPLTMAVAAGHVLKSPVREGLVVGAGLVDRQEVHAGEVVSVQVRSGGAQLRFAAKAESAGARGQQVTVRNGESGKRFAARVTGLGKVEVDADATP